MLDPYSRHKKFISDYLKYYGSEDRLIESSKNTDTPKTDYDLIKQHSKFIWPDQDRHDLDKKDDIDQWEKRMAKKYYDNLFKEYAIADLKNYKTHGVALRWRTKSEVISGKGQFECGNIKCGERKELKSWELNFIYKDTPDDITEKQALVKVRLCKSCSRKLNYRRRENSEKRKHAKKRKLEEEKVEEVLNNDIKSSTNDFDGENYSAVDDGTN